MGAQKAIRGMTICRAYDTKSLINKLISESSSYQILIKLFITVYIYKSKL